MSRVDSILEQVKELDAREMADLTSRIREIESAPEPVLSDEERRARFRALWGSISDAEGEAMLAAIEEEFEKVHDPSQ